MTEQRTGMQEVLRMPTLYGDVCVWATKPSSRKPKHFMIVLEDKNKQCLPLTDVGLNETPDATMWGGITVDICNGQMFGSGNVAVEYRKKYEVLCSLISAEGTMYRRDNGELVEVAKQGEKKEA